MLLYSKCQSVRVLVLLFSVLGWPLPSWHQTVCRNVSVLRVGIYNVNIWPSAVFLEARHGRGQGRSHEKMSGELELGSDGLMVDLFPPVFFTSVDAGSVKPWSVVRKSLWEWWVRPINTFLSCITFITNRKKNDIYRLLTAIKTNLFSQLCLILINYWTLS